MAGFNRQLRRGLGEATIPTTEVDSCQLRIAETVPVPFMGTPEAPIVVLACNPFFTDAHALGDSVPRAILEAVMIGLRLEHTDYP